MAGSLHAGTIEIIPYFAIGLFQLAAIWSGLEVWFGLSGFLGFVGALFLAYFPIIGALLGMYGAVSAWGWSWLGAGALFFWQIPIVIVAAIADRE